MGTIESYKEPNRSQVWLNSRGLKKPGSIFIFVFLFFFIRIEKSEYRVSFVYLDLRTFLQLHLRFKNVGYLAQAHDTLSLGAFG